MLKFATVLLFLSCLSCSTTHNPNPDSNSVNCDDFITQSGETNKSINIKTVDGKKIDIVDILGEETIIHNGKISTYYPYSSLKKFNFKYGVNCHINVLRDVKTIKRISDTTHQVKLNNGKEIQTGLYPVKKSYGQAYHSSYGRRDISGMFLVDLDSNINFIDTDGNLNKIDAVGDINAYKSLPLYSQFLELTVIDKPINSDLSKKVNVFVDKQKSEYEKAIKKKKLALLLRAREREEENRKTEKARLKAAATRLKAKQKAEAEKIQQKQKKREWAKTIISSNNNIGRKICKDGILKGEQLLYDGRVILGRQHYESRQENGQLLAYLEGFSPDGYRIQFRILGYSIKAGRTNYYSPPNMGDFKAQQGAIYWDDVSEWYLCN